MRPSNFGARRGGGEKEGGRRARDRRTGGMKGRDTCARWHWGRQWSSLWGHATLFWVGENVKFGFRGARGRSHLGL
eukprot:6663467-Pyramimonas_sp.AAC.1